MINHMFFGWSNAALAYTGLSLEMGKGVWMDGLIPYIYKIELKSKKRKLYDCQVAVIYNMFYFLCSLCNNKNLGNEMGMFIYLFI